MAQPLAFPSPTVPAPGDAVTVAPGILWARLPLPFRLNHVNVWLLEDGDGWTLIDAGCDTPDIRTAWGRLFAEAMEGRPASRLIATHCHVDHIGLAGWLTERFACPMVSTLTEWLWARVAHEPAMAGAEREHRTYLRRAGIGPDEEDLLVEGRARFLSLAVPLPGSVREVRDGDVVAIGPRRWRVIVSGGHAFRHISLFDEDGRVLISGDQLLPQISPVIAVYEMVPEGNPLEDFLQSFAAFDHLPADTLVLPSHGLPYVGIHTRIAALREHHRDRIKETARLLDRPMTVRDLASAMFAHVLDLDGISFAVAEVLAHLNYLVAQGRVIRSEDDTGALRYVRARN